MNKVAAILLLLVLAVPLGALDNMDTLGYTGTTWLSWTPAQRLCYLAGVTHGEITTIIRIGRDLTAAGADAGAVQANLIPYACYEGDLNALSRAITQDIMEAPARREEQLLTLLLCHKWDIVPLEPAEEVQHG